MTNCSKEGNKYEDIIFNILKHTTINDEKFNSQSPAHSTCDNDLVCSYQGTNIGIEVKKYRTPDWMQCSIKYINNNWKGSKLCKIPKKSKELFECLIKKYVIFEGCIPPFMFHDITHKEWKSIKETTDKWNDNYIDVPSDTIRNLYVYKKCNYIQISGGYGLYYLGHDVCNFGVPEFICEQELRIRTKIHKTKNSKGFCSLSDTKIQINRINPMNQKILTGRI
jgi:hypothetical protein